MSARTATGPQLWVLNRLGWLKVDTDALETEGAEQLIPENGVALTTDSASDLINLAVTRGLYTAKSKGQQ
jgi:hypothetical protein